MKTHVRALLPGFFVLFTAFAGGCMLKHLTPEATPVTRPVTSAAAPVVTAPEPRPVPAGPFAPVHVSFAEPRRPAAALLQQATAALAILPAEKKRKEELRAPIKLAPTEPDVSEIDEADEAASAASPDPAAEEPAPRTEPAARSPQPAAQDALHPTTIAIVGLTVDGQPARSPVRAYLHDKVTLHAVLRGREDGREVVVADPAVAAAGALPWRGLPVRHFTAAEQRRLAWYKVEPQGHEYWNSEPSTGRFSFKKVPYHESAWKRGQAAVVADAKPIMHQENPHGFGTMRFKLAYAKGGAEVATAGASSMQPMRQDNLFRVSYAGVTRYPLINHALELCNVPYVFGSETWSKRVADHQAEWAYGVDCADLVSYALRRAGISFPYGFTGTFDPDNGRTKFIVRPRIKDGVYVDAGGRPIPWGPGGVQPQDFVLYDGRIRHIGILFRDAAPKGVFDPSDILVHTLVAAPTFAGVQEALDAPFQVIRLRGGAPELASAPARKVSPGTAHTPGPAPAKPQKTAARPAARDPSLGS